MRNLRSRTLALGLVLPLALAACGSSTKGAAATTTAPATTVAGGSDTTGAGPTTALATTTTVGAASGATSVSGFAFHVGTFTAGTAVTVTNADSVDHTFTSADGGVDVKLPAHGSAQVTFAKAGTFKLVCKVHASMKGTVTVT